MIRSPLPLISRALALLVALAGAVGAAPADSPVFQIDTRDTTVLPTSSNFFVLDTRADPLTLDANQSLAGDISGDKRIGFDDFLLLSQYVGGSRGAGDPLIGDSAAADATGSGSVAQADVLQVGQWLLGADGAHESRSLAPGFMVAMIQPTSAAPGSLVEITITGEVAENIRAVRFGSQLSPVVGQIDEHRITVAVPILPAGGVQVAAVLDAWETPGHNFQIMPLPVVNGAPGEFSGRVVQSLGNGMAEFNRVVVPDLVALELLTPGESQDFIAGIDRMLLLLAQVKSSIDSLPAQERALIDSLLYSGDIEQALADYEVEVAKLSGPTAMRERAFSGPYDQFYRYAALDALSASLGNLKLATNAASFVLTLSGVGAPAAAPLVIGSIVIGGMKNIIDGTISTDIARLRATFSDGSQDFFIDQEKELFFLGDFRTETDPAQAVIGTALDGVFGMISLALPNAGSLMVEILQEVSLELTRAGIDGTLDHFMFNHIDLERWHYDVRIPISFYTPTSQGLMQRGLAYLPAGAVFPMNLTLPVSSTVVTRTPWIEYVGATAPASFNISNGLFAPQSPGPGTLHYDAFSFRKAKTWWGKLGTLGQSYPQRISDQGYHPFTSRYKPPFNPPSSGEDLANVAKILPFNFTVEGATVRVRPNPTSASWSISGARSLSGTGNQDFLIRPGTYNIAWGNLTGYNKPVNQTLTVYDGGTITFSGTYSTQNGTLAVRPSPQSASWTITGPNNYLSSGSGNEDRSVAPGTYTVTWGSLSGYNTPANTEVTVTNGGTATAYGMYGTTTGTLQIRPNPYNAPWTVTGPNNYSYLWQGEDNLKVAPGTYTVIWRPVSGYVTPTSEQVNVLADQITTIHGVYVENEQGPKVGGTLTDLVTGEPIVGATVRADFSIWHSQGVHTPREIMTTTDAQGRYSVTLPVNYIGGVQVYFWKLGYDRRIQLGMIPNTEVASISVDGAIQKLGNRAAFSGTVTDSVTGRPIYSAQIVVQEANFGFSTLPSGTYWSVLPGVNSWTVTVSHENYISQSQIIDSQSGVELTGVDFALVSAAAAAPSRSELNVNSELEPYPIPIPSAEDRGNDDTMALAHDEPSFSEIENETVKVETLTPMLPPVIAEPGDGPQPQLVRTPRASRMNTPDFSHLQALIDLEETVVLGSSPLPDPLPIGPEVAVTFTLALPQGVLGAFHYSLQYDPARVEITAIDSAAGSPYAASLVFTTSPGLARVMAARPQLAAAAGQAELAFVVRLRRLDGSGSAPVLRLRPLGLLDSAVDPLHSSEATLSLAAGATLGAPGLPPGALADLYEAWAAANLPIHERGHQAVSSVFGVQNLLAFALGWEANDPASRRQPAVAERESGGIWLHTRRRAGLPGLGWTWRSSDNIHAWQPVAPLESRTIPLGNGIERWEVRLPAPADRRFYQLKIQHTQP